MKKLSILTFILAFSFFVNAQDTPKLKNYTGIYTMEGGPVEAVKIEIKDGKLYGSSDQGEATLKAIEIADGFEIEGYDGKVQFNREKGVVTSMTMTIQGQEMKGMRKMPSKKDYEGNYTFEGAPFASMKVTSEDGTVYGEVEGIGKGGFENTSNIDEFYEPNYSSTITFQRNEKGIVNKVTILAQGSEMVGKKEMAASMDEYLGTFEFEGAPFNELIVTMQDGKLHGNAVGQGEAEMAVTNKADEFEIVGYDGLATYVRNADGKVSGIKLLIQGGEMEGKKK